MFFEEEWVLEADFLFPSHSEFAMSRCDVFLQMFFVVAFLLSNEGE